MSRHWHPFTGKARLPLIAAFAVVAVAGLLLGVWLSQQQRASQTPALPDSLAATVLPEGRPLQPFALIDHDERAFGPDRLRGQWTFMFFGFTHCPDVCPMTLQVLRDVAGRLEQSGTPAQFVFVSVDPERDTPDQLKSYVRYFHPQFLGVTGRIEQIDALTGQLGVLYGYEDPDPETGAYTVNHSAQILLIDPQAQLRAVFSTPHEAAAIADTFIEIHNRYGG